MSEDEVGEYFGYRTDGNMSAWDKMIADGWAEELVSFLFDKETVFGEVFTYNGSNNAAMLVLFKTDSGTLEGGFYGLNGDREGKQVYRSTIQTLNSTSKIASDLEEFYHNAYENLPKAYGTNGTPYYHPSRYVQTGTWGNAAAAATFTGVTVCIIAFPCGIAAGGITLTGAIGATATIAGGIFTAADLMENGSLSNHYPVILQPSLNVLGQVEYYDPVDYGFLAPRGKY